MKQAIAGVTPAHVAEKTVMVVWPSIAAYPSGRWLGGLYSISAGVWVITVGNLLALASIPHALFLYFYRLGTGKSYRLTNRRVVEMATTTRFRTMDRFPFFSMKVTIGDEVKSVDLDRFDAIDLVVRPGQAWFHAGDLVFRLGNVETFRLDAVSRPDVFRQTCLKSQAAFKGVRQALQRQAVPA